MNILGVSGGFARENQDGAVALLVDGRLEFAQEEERFVRQSHAIGHVPELAITAALEHADLSIHDIDAIAFHIEWPGIREKLEDFFRFRFGWCPRIHLVNHHYAHAASAYYASGFSNAMVLTADLSGDGLSTTLCAGDGRNLRTLRAFRKPQPLGIFYSIATQVLGFRRDNGEYKVMGDGGLRTTL